MFLDKLKLLDCTESMTESGIKDESQETTIEFTLLFYLKIECIYAMKCLPNNHGPMSSIKK